MGSKIRELGDKFGPPTLLIVFFLLSVGAWYGYLTHTPISRDDFTTVIGTVVQAEAIRLPGPGNIRTLELYIAERPERFWVDFQTFEKRFNKDAFLSSMHPESRITLHVNPEHLQNPPIAPLLHGKPTIFVYGMSGPQWTYCDIGAYIREKNDVFVVLVIAILWSGITLFLAYYVFERARVKRQGLIAAVSPPPASRSIVRSSEGKIPVWVWIAVAGVLVFLVLCGLFAAFLASQIAPPRTNSPGGLKTITSKDGCTLCRNLSHKTARNHFT
ncbi:hypothetical protein AYO44_04650 [Planctomycetaceae bacterium SCGC AG-212-F19]|nr:hypothetical protein AYO44_04650 [Planctomycetaceae bacterium SCGC AG-212-F19]